MPDITAGLNAAAKSYNGGVAALAKAGGDAAAADKANAQIKAAQAKIDALCKTNNFETPQCLAQYGIQLAAIPAADGSKPVAAAPVQPVEVITNLPKGVTQQEVAPLLDSARTRKPARPRPQRQRRHSRRLPLLPPRRRPATPRRPKATRRPRPA